MIRATVKLNDPLYRLLAEEADRLNVPMNEGVVILLAKSFGRPDLGYVERKRSGLPRRNCVEAKN